MVKHARTHLDYLPVYVGALAFVGVLVVASHVVLDRIAGEQAISARMVHMASEQNELTQRAARFTLEFLDAEEEADRRELRLLIKQSHDALMDNHLALTRGDVERGIPAAAWDSIEKIYYEEPHFLDQRLRLYMHDIREVIDRDWAADLRSNVYVRAIVDNSRNELLGTLRDATAAFLDDSIARVDRLRFMLKVMHGAIIAGLIFVGSFVFYPLFRRIQRQRQRLLNQTRTDVLTGALNRRSFNRAARAEFARTKRYGSALSVMMIDIDSFKKLNDRFGHAAGDDVIRALAGICLEKLRQSDVFARIGGEEFAAILPETGQAEAVAVAEKLRDMLSNTSIPSPRADGPIRFTVSIGVAQLGAGDADFDALLYRADMGLYEAKRLGRNRVAAAGPADETDTAIALPADGSARAADLN